MSAFHPAASESLLSPTFVAFVTFVTLLIIVVDVVVVVFFVVVVLRPTPYAFVRIMKSTAAHILPKPLDKQADPRKESGSSDGVN